MKILHLFSDSRKTGPADPVIRMCQGLLRRGHDVTLAHSAAAHARLTDAIRRAEVPMHGRLALDRYLHPVRLVRDLIDMPRLLRAERYDVVHTHLRHDQALAIISCRGLHPDRPRIINTLHRRHVLDDRFSYRWLLQRCDGVTAFAAGFAEGHAARFDLDRRRVGVVPPSLDAATLDPAADWRDMRQHFKVPPDAVVIGIVARFQSYRRMEVFFRAARAVADTHPNARFLVIGRSRSIEKTVYEPIRRLNLKEQVIVAGYRTDDYYDTLACLDIFTLLMPGSDGTARAVHEAMALAKACAVSDVGMLPELVPHEQAGLVCPLDPDALAGAWRRLIDDPALRKRLGDAARAAALEQFDPAASAQTLERFYQRIIEMPPLPLTLLGSRRPSSAA